MPSPKSNLPFMKDIRTYVRDKTSDPNYIEFIPFPDNPLDERLLLLNSYKDTIKKLEKELLSHEKEEKVFKQIEEDKTVKSDINLPQTEKQSMGKKEEAAPISADMLSLLPTKEPLEELKKDMVDFENMILESDDFKKSYDELIRKEQENVTARVVSGDVTTAKQSSSKKKNVRQKNFAKKGMSKAQNEKKNSNIVVPLSSEFNKKAKEYLEELSNANRIKFKKLRKIMNLGRKASCQDTSHDENSQVTVDGSHSVLHTAIGTATFVRKHGSRDISYNAKEAVNFARTYLDIIKSGLKDHTS